MKYGLPYQGSKNKIAEWVVAHLPTATHLYDLFAGGCAITHAALLSGRYEYVHANDISDAPLLFDDAVNGKYRDEKRWISREDFFRLKDADPYVRLCWSFGINLRDYLYSRKIEPYKKALHHAVMFGDFALLHTLCPEVAESCEEALRDIKDTKQRRIEIGRAVVRWLKAYGTPEMVEANPLYNSCHRKRQRLQSLVTQKDYRNVEIMQDSVIYCDIPYKGTKGYQKEGFDHETFYQWALAQDVPVFISEYSMPEDFVCIAERERNSTYSSTNNSLKTTERLFIPKHQRGMYEEMMQNTLR